MAFFLQPWCPCPGSGRNRTFGGSMRRRFYARTVTVRFGAAIQHLYPSHQTGVLRLNLTGEGRRPLVPGPHPNDTATALFEQTRGREETRPEAIGLLGRFVQRRFAKVSSSSEVSRGSPRREDCRGRLRVTTCWTLHAEVSNRKQFSSRPKRSARMSVSSSSSASTFDISRFRSRALSSLRTGSCGLVWCTEPGHAWASALGWVGRRSP